MNHPERSSRFVAHCALALLGALPLMAQACNDQPYIGDICTFAFDWCPRGYAPADGTLMQINQNQALYSLIGVTFGGDARNTFALPDLRGRSAVGTGTGASPALVNIASGQRIGQQAVGLSVAQAPLAAHTHGVGVGLVKTPQQIAIPATTGALTVSAVLPANTNVVGSGTPPAGHAYLTNVTGQTNNTATITGPYVATEPNGISSLPASIVVGGSGSTPSVTATVNSMTGGTVSIVPNNGALPSEPVSTQSPALGMNVCIAVSGLYSPRP